MKTILRALILLVIAVSQPSLVFAQDDREAEKLDQQTFRAEFQHVIEALNAGSFEPFLAAIDKKDMLDRIFGLRLIDQKVKKAFQEDFDNNLHGMVKATIERPDSDIKATLLDFKSRGNRGRAVVRFDVPEFQFIYHEYDLRRDSNGRLIIVDWIDFLQGEQFSKGVGTSLVMALPGKPATRKLLDLQNVNNNELFKMTELLKAARDRRADKYFELVTEFDERFQRQRVVVLTGVHLAKQVGNRRILRKALIAVARHYPDEPLYSLMLLDYYFPARRFEDAAQSLLRLQERLGVVEAAMQARLSAAALVMGNAEDAGAYANSAIELEPSLELGWWSAMRARVALSQFDRAVEALQQLEQQFERSLGPEALAIDKSLAELVASEEYKSWLVTRK